MGNTHWKWMRFSIISYLPFIIQYHHCLERYIPKLEKWNTCRLTANHTSHTSIKIFTHKKITKQATTTRSLVCYHHLYNTRNSCNLLFIPNTTQSKIQIKRNPYRVNHPICEPAPANAQIQWKTTRKQNANFDSRQIISEFPISVSFIV